MDLKTTTYPGRNLPILAAAAKLAPDARTILEIGPGLALKGFGWRTRRGAPLRHLARVAESVLRRLPLPESWYESFETAEIRDAFDPERSGRAAITVVDINPRPLRVIRRTHGDAVRCVNLDFGSRSEDLIRLGRFDVVVALAVIGRIPEEKRSIATGNLLDVTSIGGLIVTSHETGFGNRAGEVEATGIPWLFRRIRAP